MSTTAQKVTAFVTRVTSRGTDLLLFEHPHAGIQLPAGTVEVGEPHAIAAAREAYEETGLHDLPPGRFLDEAQEPLSPHHYLLLTTSTIFPRPDRTGFDWATIRYGIRVVCDRQEGDFAHVTYQERDDGIDPAFVSYQITGWVDRAVLTRDVMRYFYHFPYHGNTPTTWHVDTDNHRFRLFWAPLAQLPTIVAPQRWWVDVLLRADL
ncbi:MAG TPA: NUDIX domain-containing protein [Caldilineaceae bacterium]|nr:NUDIX domain-containing protein [Caldilineaceae bacterium]